MSKRKAPSEADSRRKKVRTSTAEDRAILRAMLRIDPLAIRKWDQLARWEQVVQEVKGTIDHANVGVRRCKWRYCVLMRELEQNTIDSALREDAQAVYFQGEDRGEQATQLQQLRAENARLSSIVDDLTASRGEQAAQLEQLRGQHRNLLSIVSDLAGRAESDIVKLREECKASIGIIFEQAKKSHKEVANLQTKVNVSATTINQLRGDNARLSAYVDVLAGRLTRQTKRATPALRRKSHEEAL